MFSDREQRVINIIGRKKITYGEILNQLFKGVAIPMDADILTGNTVRRIIKKCQFNKLDWTLNINKEDSKLVVSKEKI